MKPLVIKWAFRHGVLDGDEFDSLDEATRAAFWASEQGGESLHGIEVIHEDGASVLYQRADLPLWRQLEAEEDARYKGRAPSVAMIEVDMADMTVPARMHGFSTVEAARAEAERLRRHLGDRVHIRPWPWTYENRNVEL